MEPLEIAQEDYLKGRIAFERGEYGEAIACLEQAKARVNEGEAIALRGEIQIWLVTAYEAAGKRLEALSLCQTLEKHPHLATRKQARRLLEILRAPQLNRPAEWNTKIPDLSSIDGSDRLYRRGAGVSQVKPSNAKSESVEGEDSPPPLTEDNQFVWIALMMAGLAIAGFIWWG